MYPGFSVPYLMLLNAHYASYTSHLTNSSSNQGELCSFYLGSQMCWFTTSISPTCRWLQLTQLLMEPELTAPWALYCLHCQDSWFCAQYLAGPSVIFISILSPSDWKIHFPLCQNITDVQSTGCCPLKMPATETGETSGRTTFRTQPKSPKNPEQPLQMLLTFNVLNTKKPVLI